MLCTQVKPLTKTLPWKANVVSFSVTSTEKPPFKRYFLTSKKSVLHFEAKIQKKLRKTVFRLNIIVDLF